MRREDKKRVENIENIFDKIMAEKFLKKKKKTKNHVQLIKKYTRQKNRKKSIPTYYKNKETDIHVQDAQKFPNQMNTKKSIPRYYIIKAATIKNCQRKTKSHISKEPP